MIFEALHTSVLKVLIKYLLIASTQVGIYVGYPLMSQTWIEE